MSRYETLTVAQKARLKNPVLAARLASKYDPLYVENLGSDHEEYRLDCPWCQSHDPDTKQRCRILWNFGVDGRYGGIYCYHNDCFNEDESVYDVYEGKKRLFMYIMDGRPVFSNMTRPSTVESKPLTARPLVDLIGLSQLPLEHPANLFVEERGFDNVYLDECFGVAYCPLDHPSRMMAGRLIFPVFTLDENWNPTYVGCQARLIPDHTQNRTDVKALTQPGFAKSWFPYRFDHATRQSVAVITEGPFDALSVGDEGFALFGKTLRMELAHELMRRMSRWVGGTIVIALDADAPGREAAKKIRSQLASFPRVFIAHLPEGRDPGSFGVAHQLELRDRIYYQARSLDIELPGWNHPFSRPQEIGD